MEQAFTNVYETNAWGNDHNEEYCGSSGGGSEIALLQSTYVPVLRKFIQEKGIKSVVDLGHGSFKCGPLIYDDLDVTYLGYDAYKKIVDYNSTKFQGKYTFRHLDFCTYKEQIQGGDMCILKDVIQHWNSISIKTFLDYLVDNKVFKYIFICNCCSPRSKNEDIRDGEWRCMNYDLYPFDGYKMQTLYSFDTKTVAIIDTSDARK